MSQKSETKPQEEPQVATYLTLLKDNNDAVAMYLEDILSEAELIECSDVPEKFISNSLPIFYGLIAMKHYIFHNIPYPATYAILMEELPTEEEEFSMIIDTLKDALQKFPINTKNMTKEKAVEKLEILQKYTIQRIREENA